MNTERIKIPLHLFQFKVKSLMNRTLFSMVNYNNFLLTKCNKILSIFFQFAKINKVIILR